MAATSLEFRDALTQSRQWQGGLGAVVWTLKAALEQGGAPSQDIERVTQILKEYLPNISNQDCNQICQVLERRLFEDKQADSNAWY